MLTTISLRFGRHDNPKFLMIRLLQVALKQWHGGS